MIRLQDLTPSIYYTQSRDFQFIGRLYDIVLNAVKTNADNLYLLPINKNMDERLLNLLATTLGFQTKKLYNSAQLVAICNVLPIIMRKKGSVNAAITAVHAMLCAEGIKQPLSYSIDKKKNIVLYVPEIFSDISLLRDLLPYVLPAGIGCEIVKESTVERTATTTITTDDEVFILKDGNLEVPGERPEDLSQLIRLRRPTEAETATEKAKLKDILYYTTDSSGNRAKQGLLPNMIIAPQVYTVTWYMDNGQKIDTTKASYRSIPKHDAPTKSGYTFVGWSLTQGGDVTEIAQIRNDESYYAVFTQNS